MNILATVKSQHDQKTNKNKKHKGGREVVAGGSL